MLMGIHSKLISEEINAEYNDIGNTAQTIDQNTTSNGEPPS